MRLQNRDKGYAWVVVGAGSLVMFVGPSIYTSYGTFFGPIEMPNAIRLWILNLSCVLWFGIATFAGPLAAMNTNRKLVMFGLFSASCGLTITGLISQYPSWLFLTFSCVVGIGLGIGVHETFLLVVCHFERYRGIAIGILYSSALLGQIVSPLIYEALAEVKDRCYIRALMTAIAFMSASFYISPHIGPILQEEEIQGLSLQSINLVSTPIPHTTRQHRERKKSGESGKVELKEAIPLVPIKNSKPKLNNHHSHHHHSLGSAQGNPAYFLPNIPEEAESITSVGSNSSRERIDDILLKLKVTPIDGELEKRIALIINKSRSSSQESALDPQNSRPYHDHPIKPLNPELIRRVEDKINNITRNPVVPKSMNIEQSVTPHRRGRGSIFRYRLDSIFDPEIDFMEVRRRTSEGRSETEITIKGREYTWKDAISETDWGLVRNWKFLSTGLSCAFTVLAFPNFPVIFTSHLLAIHKEEAEKNLSKVTTVRESSNFSNVESILILIYISDAVSRISIGYLSDFYIFNRKIAFYGASFIGGCLILGVPFVRDIEVINVICCLFGVCHGTLIVTESLMFADEFGVRKLPASYGIMNAFKSIIILILTPVLASPMSAFMYPIQPFVSIPSWNFTICHHEEGCDPLDIFNESENFEDTLQKTTWLCISIGLCGILSGMTWAGQVLINFLLTFKEKEHMTILESEKILSSYPFPGVRRCRSNSNPT